MSNSSKCYGLYDDKHIIGFIAVIHQPHGINKRIKRVTRMVILPDYQGIGLGVKFLNEIAKIYSSLKFDFSIKTSAKNLIFALKKDKNWLLNSYGFSKCSSNKSTIDFKRKTMRNKNKTASFMFKKN